MIIDPDPYVIQVQQLSKRYGRKLALDGVTLRVPENSLFALLGPNGAGKTTLLNILCTLLPPDSGTATVAGFDVVKAPLRARSQIGVVFQEPSLDDRLSAAENLEFHGLVYGMPPSAVRRGITDLLELVELADWRHAIVRTFSAGMKRRLEIARALLHAPRILFLDEPTVGLDAQTRQRMWTYLDELRRKRELTVVVTTHYIEEVEECDTVCIIDHGKVLASGTPDKLKQQFGSELVKVVPRDPQAAADLLAAYPDAAERDPNVLVIPVVGTDFSDRLMAQFGQRIRQVSFVTPSLESVFISLTGQELRDKASNDRERTLAFAKSGGEHTR